MSSYWPTLLLYAALGITLGLSRVKNINAMIILAIVLAIENIDVILAGA